MPVVDKGDTEVVVLVCIVADETGGVMDIDVDGITDGMDSLVGGIVDRNDVDGINGNIGGVGNGGAAFSTFTVNI